MEEGSELALAVSSRIKGGVKLKSCESVICEGKCVTFVAVNDVNALDKAATSHAIDGIDAVNAHAILQQRQHPRR